MPLPSDGDTPKHNIDSSARGTSQTIESDGPDAEPDECNLDKSLRPDQKRRRVSKQLRSHKKDPLCIHVVEDHDEVLGPLHRALGSRLLPFSGNIMLHFDAHPDLLLPTEMPADAVFDRDVLCEHASVASWLLPLVYAGHLSHVVWFKPVWAAQIADGSHVLRVGRHRVTGTLSTDSTLPYFEDEQLSSPSEQLLDAKQSSPSAAGTTDVDVALDPKVVADVVGAVRSAAGGVVLDVCLDFFSAHNPFRADVTPEFFALLTRLFAAHSASSDTFQSHMTRHPGARGRFLESIKAALTAPLGVDLTTARFAEMHGAPECCADVEKQSETLRELHRHVTALHEAAPPGCAVNSSRLVDVGITTDLPHHESSVSEVSSLLAGVRQWLATIVPVRTPLIATLARSADDGYTPTTIADDLEARVISEIRGACGVDTKVIVHTEESRAAGD